MEIDELPDDTYGIPYTKSISVQAVANWVVEAGDIIYSDLYTVTDGLIQGIKCGTTAAELWLNLHTLPGTQARIYTDDTKSRQRTGIIQTGDILTADNALLGYHKTYTLKTKGMALNSAIYNIGSGFIMGIAEDTEIDAFMANMNIVGSGTWQIRGNDGRNKETGKIETGDVLTLTAGSLTEEYVLETTTPKDRVYFYDDFENGSKGSWNNGDIVRDSDGKYGQSIAWSTIDASRENPASISAARTFSTEGKPQILVYETEFKMPIYANVTVSNYLRNAKNEALATIRIDDRNQLGALVPGGASVLLENLQNKWYHAKYVCDNIDGKMNAYVDGKLVGEGLQFQAKEDYFPDKITVGASNIQTAGTLFMLDNVTVYEPNPIKVGKLTIMQDNVSSTDLRNIPVNTDAIQIQFTKQAGFDIDTDHAADKVKLLDENGRTVSSVGTLDAKTGIYTLQINEILTPKRGYQIVVEKIQDTVYHKNYSIAVPVTTGMEPAYIKKPSIIDVEGNMAEKIQNEKVTVVIPIVNLGEDAELTTILACYDETGRIVAVFKKTADAEKRGLTEVSLSCDLTSKISWAAVSKYL